MRRPSDRKVSQRSQRACSRGWTRAPSAAQTPSRLIRGVTRWRDCGRALFCFGLLVGMLAGLSAGSASAAGEGDPKHGSGELDRLRSSIIEARERVGTREREEREIFEILEQMDRQIESLRHEVANSKREAARSRKRFESARTREASLRVRLDKTRGFMSRRVVALYKSGEIGAVRVLFSSESVPDMMSRMSILQRLLKSDAALVARYGDEWREVEDANRVAKERAEEWESAAARLSLRSDALTTERATRSELLDHVRDDRTAERRILVELEKAARVLEETLATLGSTSRSDARNLDGFDFEAGKGQLPWPVAARVSRRFGRVVDAQYLTETFRKGVEFEAPAGDSVRAVAPGAVRYVGWFRGYGKIVIIDHGDQFFTVSGHLSETFVEVDGMVAVGDTIGSVGETGSFSGPNLYFEVRRGSEPLDPAAWLGPETTPLQARKAESG